MESTEYQLAEQNVAKTIDIADILTIDISDSEKQVGRW